MGRQVIPDTEPIWKALADPTRRALLDLLRDGPRTTTQLCEPFPTSRYAIMGHLEVLVAAGLVVTERRGRKRFNHLNPVPLQQAHDRWMSRLAGSAASTVLALAGAAESEETTTMEPTVDIRAEHLVRRDAERTWASLMQLAQWWPRCWPEGEGLAFTPRLGGQLAVRPESDRAGVAQAGVLWGVVEELYAARSLAIRGPMGLRGPVSGYWRMVLDSRDDMTLVCLHHQIAGPISDADRRCFEAGWPATLEALAAVAEGPPHD